MTSSARARRRRLGRPDLAAHASLFDVPAATSGPSVTFLGVSSLLLDDGHSAILFDGFFTRPSLPRVALGRIAPDTDLVARSLGRLGFGPSLRRLDAVLPVHSHYDHALDAAAVVQVAGGLLVGGTSTANVGRGGGLDEERIRVVADGETTTTGSWTCTHLASAHCPPDRYPGTIDAPLVPPARARTYRCGEAWSVLVEHRSGRRTLVQGSAGFVPGVLAGGNADVVHLGVGQLGVRPEQYIRDYWEHTVRAVGGRRVVLTHWDDFFRPLDRPLRALPHLGDDLDRTVGVLTELAATDGCHLALPRVWRREDPWAGLPGGRTNDKA